MIEMSLGDGFTKRKQLQSEIDRWMKRLNLSGKDSIDYTVNGSILTKDKAIAGSLKKFKRSFSIEECLDNITKLVEKDRELATRISLTNQIATTTMVDLDGVEVEVTIPELIILKNEIAPRLEEIQRHIPKLTLGYEIIEEKDDYTKWRTIAVIGKRESTITEQGHRIDRDILVGRNIKEVTDYGYTERKIYDEVDKIQAWQFRLKEAINQANKTILIP